MNQFALQIPQEIERQLRRCRASIRESIHARLQEIVAGAETQPRRGKPSTPRQPALRFYVFDGYRVSYQLDPVTRTVRVLELRTEPG